MDDKTLDKRIAEANEIFLSEPTEGGSDGEPYVPTDLYNERALKRKEMANKGKLNGSRPKIAIDVRAVVEKLAPAHQKAKNDSDVLKARGDLSRAEIVKQQYTNDVFLPALESLVMMNSADELVNNTTALAELDKYATLDKSSGSGFSASFIKTLHGDERGMFSGQSDDVVRGAVRDIKRLAGTDNIRGAVSMAKRIKDKIERGDNIASEDDYELILRVALR